MINPVDSDRCTTVLDLKGVSLATAAKAEIMQFIKQAVTMMSTHYPEVSYIPYRMYKLYCISSIFMCAT